MNIKVLEGKEYVQADRLMTMAFNINWSGDHSLEEALAELEQRQREGELLAERLGAFDANGELMAQVEFGEYQSYLWGAPVRMEGIGGVATLPQFRRQGAVRRIMALGFERMKARGTVISTLYPFSSAFYGKFGYESFVEAESWQVDTQGIRLRHEAPAGTWHLLQDPASASLRQKQWDRDYRNLTEAVESRYQLGTQRTEKQWADLIRSAESHKGEHFSYIFYDADTKPLTCCTLRIGSGEERSVMQLRHVICRNGEGVRALLAFLQRFSNDQRRAELLLPTGSSLDRYLSEHAGVASSSQRLHGMLAVVDVRAFLEHYVRYAPDVRPMQLSIFDAFSGWNSGLYTIRLDKTSAYRVDFLPVSEDDEERFKDAVTKLTGDPKQIGSRMHAHPAGLALLLLGLEDAKHLEAAGLIDVGSEDPSALRQLRKQAVYLAERF